MTMAIRRIEIDPASAGNLAQVRALAENRGLVVEARNGVGEVGRCGLALIAAAGGEAAR
jgi:hypothetical protein